MRIEMGLQPTSWRVVNSDAYTHRERREMETLPEALGRSAEQSQPPENLHKMTMKKTKEKSSVLVRQCFVLHKT